MKPALLSLHVSLALAAAGGPALAQEFPVQVVDGPPTVPGNLVANPYSATAAGVAWERSEDDVGVLGYEVTLDGEVVQESDASTYVDFDLAPGTTYTVGVTAIDTARQRSETATVEFTTRGGTATSGGAGAPGPAPVMDLRANVYSTTALGLIWTRPSAFGQTYEVSRDGEPLDTTDGVTFVDTGLEPGTYAYEVVAIGADGTRSAPTGIEVSTEAEDMTIPTAPTDGGGEGGTATPTGNSILDLARGTDEDGDGVFTGGAEGVDTLLAAGSAYPELLDLLDDETATLTVFAPTDEAFADVDLDALDEETLGEVLRYHVVADTAFDTMAIGLGTAFPLTLETVQGGTIEIADAGDGSLVAIDAAGARVALDEVVNSASNGVVYLIDTVLTPPPAADVDTDVDTDTDTDLP